MAKLDLDKAQKLLSYIGFDNSVIESLPEETFEEDFKKSFDSKYHTEETFLKSEPFKKVIGNLNGSRITSFKKIAKKFAVDLEGDDLKDQNPEIAFEAALTKQQALNNAAIEEYKKQAELSKDENFKKLEEKFNKRNKDFEQIEAKNNEYKDQIEKQAKEFDGKFKTEKLNFHKKSLYQGIDWGTDDALKRKGFLADYNERFDHDLDENETLIPIDRKTGEKIFNPDKSKTFMDAASHLQKEAIENKVWRTNPKGGEPAPRTPFQRTPTPAPAGTPATRTAGTPALAINTYKDFPGNNGQ